MSNIQNLISCAQSSDNQVRETAENELLQACDANASIVFKSLIDVANNENELLASRQFCILSLRKLITMYWSPGFESYRATSGVNEDIKNYLRDSLLKLCLSGSQDTKIKSSSSYCIVQISAVDFPDLWPQLLVVIYDSILKDYSIEAMSLLNEIYDDVISEEMFFEGGIGTETIKVVYTIITSNVSSIEPKLAASKLLHSCILQMSILDNSMSSKRKDFVSQCISQLLELWIGLLPQLNVEQSEAILAMKSIFYEDISTIKTEFPKKLFPKTFIENFKAIALKDLELLGNLYVQIVQNDASEEELKNVNEYAIHIIDFISNIATHGFDNAELTRIISSLGFLCCLDKYTADSWQDDFNTYISKESGLVASYTIRDQAAQFLSVLSNPYFSVAYGLLLQEINKNLENASNYVLQESLLFMLESMVSNDCDISPDLLSFSEGILRSLESLIVNANTNIIVKSRCLLLCPKLLEKFMDTLSDVKPMTRHLLSISIKTVLESSIELLNGSMLIAFTFYANFADLLSVLGQEECQLIQKNMLHIIKEITTNAEEDTFGVCAEAMNHVIDNNSDGQDATIIRDTEFNLLLTISSKDPGNIQLSVESQECLEKLLDHMDINMYTHYANKVIPSLLKIIVGYSQIEYKYSPLLSLTLEFLMTFMKKKPVDSKLPVEISKMVFNPLRDVLVFSNEEETIQLATEAFSFLLYNSDSSLMQNALEDIVAVLSKLLSMDVSDTAAMNVGTLIVTIFTTFAQQIENIIPSILQATTKKFVNAKNITTSQNLLTVFCFLTCSDTQQTVDFLYNLSIDPSKEQNSLALVLSKWLDLFEVIQGERRIKENIMALSKIFFLSDQRIATVIVNGDIIPYSGDKIITRSMAKTIPDQFTQVSVHQKIIKLFINELASQTKEVNDSKVFDKSFQNLAQQESNQPEKGDEKYEDDWEDVDDVLDYDKLQEYVDDEDDLQDYSDNDDENAPTMSILGNMNQSVTDILIDFFKEIASKNINSFQEIYNALSENEKRVLTETLV